MASPATIGALGQPGGGHDQVVAGAVEHLGGHPDVVDVGAHRRGHVGDEGPGRGRPHQQVGAVEVLVVRPHVDQREPHVDAGVDDVAVHVGLAQLVGRQGGAAPGAVGADLVALVEQVLLPQLGEQPPHRLDVVVGQGPVGVGGVDPGARSGGQRRPVLHVALHRVAAVLVEGGHAVGLDLVLGVQAQGLLHLELDRQAVAVPAALAGHGLAPHGLEAGVEVLEHPGPHVVQAGAPVGRRGALVEDPGLGVLAQAPGLGHHVMGAPAGQHRFFERDQVEVGIGGTEGHRSSLGGAPTRSIGVEVSQFCS